MASVASDRRDDRGNLSSRGASDRRGLAGTAPRFHPGLRIDPRVTWLNFRRWSWSSRTCPAPSSPFSGRFSCRMARARRRLTVRSGGSVRSGKGLSVLLRPGLSSVLRRGFETGLSAMELFRVPVWGVCALAPISRASSCPPGRTTSHCSPIAARRASAPPPSPRVCFMNKAARLRSLSLARKRFQRRIERRAVMVMTRCAAHPAEIFRLNRWKLSNLSPWTAGPSLRGAGYGENWIPVGAVTALYGDGGTGKEPLGAATDDGLRDRRNVPSAKASTIAVLSAYSAKTTATNCIVAGRSSIVHRMSLSFADLGDMRWISRVGSENLLATFIYRGRVRLLLLVNPKRREGVRRAPRSCRHGRRHIRGE